MTSSRPRRSAALALVLALGLAPALAACGGQAAPKPVAVKHTATSPSAPKIRPGDTIAKPTGPVVLTVKGGTVHNVGNTLQLDLAQLESMGTVSYSVNDGQATGRRATFSGPLVRTVLAVAGASGTSMAAAALNDYTVNVPVSDAKSLPLMLATRMDGKPMTVADYGPTRFIYPTEGYHLKKAVYDARWIWQLASLTIT